MIRIAVSFDIFTNKYKGDIAYPTSDEEDDFAE
jgi:hypothetical protein